MELLDGRRTIVTGAGKRIGANIAESLAAEDATEDELHRHFNTNVVGNVLITCDPSSRRRPTTARSSASPGEIGPVTLFLSSAAAQPITGVVLFASGGQA